MGGDYVCHRYIGGNYSAHIFTGHTYISSAYISHNYVDHKYYNAVSRSVPGDAPVVDASGTVVGCTSSSAFGTELGSTIVSHNY